MLLLSASLLVLGNVCEFSTEVHGAVPASAHEREQGDEPHHHSVAHLTACEGAAIASSAAPEVGPDAPAAIPNLGAWLEPPQDRVAAIGRVPVPTSSPPLFVLHASLLI